MVARWLVGVFRYASMGSECYDGRMLAKIWRYVTGQRAVEVKPSSDEVQCYVLPEGARWELDDGLRSYTLKCPGEPTSVASVHIIGSDGRVALWSARVSSVDGRSWGQSVHRESLPMAKLRAEQMLCDDTRFSPCTWCNGEGFVGVVPCRECRSTGSG